MVETEAMKFLKAVDWRPNSWEFSDWKLRDEYILKFGFAILNRFTVELLKDYQPLLEVGAGCGYWSYELQQAGTAVIATDPGTGTYAFQKQLKHWDNLWTSVERLTALEAVEKYPNQALLTVWPDMASWPHEMLEAYSGDTVIYVGESDGGCTADEKFHDMLEEKFELHNSYGIPQFVGLHDYLQIYKRRKS